MANSADLLHAAGGQIAVASPCGHFDEQLSLRSDGKYAFAAAQEALRGAQCLPGSALERFLEAAARQSDTGNPEPLADLALQAGVDVQLGSPFGAWLQSVNP